MVASHHPYCSCIYLWVRLMFSKIQKDKVVEGVGAGESLGSVSKKVNCPAKIFLKDVIKFPEFKVSLQHVFFLFICHFQHF